MKQPGLKKQLSPLSVWALAFGCIIGWGSFVNPGKKFLPNSGVAGTAIAMVLGALVMMIIAFSFLSLSSPKDNAHTNATTINIIPAVASLRGVT